MNLQKFIIEFIIEYISFRREILCIYKYVTYKNFFIDNIFLSLTFKIYDRIFQSVNVNYTCSFLFN